MEGTVVEAKLLFFSAHYQIALLEIAYLEVPVDITLDIPFGSSPKYGHEVFALARDRVVPDGSMWGNYVATRMS
uniref:Uncharacterized protein n=1 Tax=Arundo donax TaxID=35708 RepID=A0A0A9GEK1_ARUDO